MLIDKKFESIEINMEKKIFTLEPDTFNVSNRVIYDGTIHEVEDGYIIEGDQMTAGVHDEDWSPVDPETVWPTFVKEIDVTKIKRKWKWLFGIIPYPGYDKIKSVKKEVKKGWVLLKEREPVKLVINGKFEQIIEIKEKKKEDKKKEK